MRRGLASCGGGLLRPKVRSYGMPLERGDGGAKPLAFSCESEAWMLHCAMPRFWQLLTALRRADAAAPHLISYSHPRPSAPRPRDKATIGLLVMTLYLGIGDNLAGAGHGAAGPGARSTESLHQQRGLD